jgi:hypothetical protein
MCQCASVSDYKFRRLGLVGVFCACVESNQTIIPWRPKPQPDENHASRSSQESGLKAKRRLGIGTYVLELRAWGGAVGAYACVVGVGDETMRGWLPARPRSGPAIPSPHGHGVRTRTDPQSAAQQERREPHVGGHADLITSSPSLPRSSSRLCLLPVPVATNSDPTWASRSIAAPRSSG